MAKSRDKYTRHFKRYDERDSERMGRRYRSDFADLKGGQRPKGRRGVRARARKARIAARQANGTYTQPGGGKITNS